MIKNFKIQAEHLGEKDKLGITYFGNLNKSTFHFRSTNTSDVLPNYFSVVIENNKFSKAGWTHVLNAEVPSQYKKSDVNEIVNWIFGKFFLWKPCGNSNVLLIDSAHISDRNSTRIKLIYKGNDVYFFESIDKNDSCNDFLCLEMSDSQFNKAYWVKEFSCIAGAVSQYKYEEIKEIVNWIVNKYIAKKEDNMGSFHQEVEKLIQQFREIPVVDKTSKNQLTEQYQVTSDCAIDFLLEYPIESFTAEEIHDLKEIVSSIDKYLGYNV